MNRSKSMSYLISTCMLLLFVHLLDAADITGFTPIKIVGDCKVKSPSGYDPIKLESRYAFGQTVKTGRNSYLDIEFSEGNMFRLLARSTVILNENVKNPKLKVLELTKGSLDLKLDQFPKDHKLQVETPSAICGAVGTRFKVAFEDASIGGALGSESGSRAHRFICDQGEVKVASRFTVDDEIQIGKTFTVESITAGSDMVAILQEGLDNAFTDVTVNRGRLTFNYGGDEGIEFSVESEEGRKPSRFSVALAKKEDGSQFIALKMFNGKADLVFFGGEMNLARITSDDGAVLVPKTSAVQNITKGGQVGQLAQQILQAAESEGKENAKLVDLKNAGASASEIKAQEAKVKAAASRTKSLSQGISAEPKGFRIKQGMGGESEGEDKSDGDGDGDGEGASEGGRDGAGSSQSKIKIQYCCRISALVFETKTGTETSALTDPECRSVDFSPCDLDSFCCEMDDSFLDVDIPAELGNQRSECTAGTCDQLLGAIVPFCCDQDGEFTNVSLRSSVGIERDECSPGACVSGCCSDNTGSFVTKPIPVDAEISDCFEGECGSSESYCCEEESGNFVTVDFPSNVTVDPGCSKGECLEFCCEVSSETETCANLLRPSVHNDPNCSSTAGPCDPEHSPSTNSPCFDKGSSGNP